MAWSRTLSKYGMAARIAVRNKWNYPLDLLGPVLSFCIFVSIFSLVYGLAYADKALIAGYTCAQVTWYFMFAEFTVFAGGAVFPSLSQDIQDGQIAYTLGRPFSLVFYNLAQYLGVAVAQSAFFLVPGALICTLAVGPLPFPGWAMLPVVVAGLLLGMVLKFFLHTAVALSAFWVEDNTAFYWILSKVTLVCGTLMPFEFLPDSWQQVLVWTPFPWVTWAGARLASVANADVVSLLGGLAAWTMVMALVSLAVFRFGARRTTVQGG